MDRFISLVAPTRTTDFFVKLALCVLASGAINHLRDLLTDPLGHKTFWENATDAAFTALPMCTLALLLIGHLNKLQRELRAAAMRDPLTSLPNRRWFTANSPALFSRKHALLLIDIDHFKRVNDRFGHDIGDACLVAFATFLADVLPVGVKPARLGGEEFGVVLTGMSDDDVSTLANRIAVGMTFDIGDQIILRISASVGIAHPPTALSLSETFAAADKALYAAKANGRARACQADYPGMSQEGSDKLDDLPSGILPA